MARRTIGVYGASDDLVEVEIDGKPHEELSEPTSFVFSADGKALHVDVEHDGKRGWIVSTVLVDDSESGDLPFKVEIAQQHYSPKLVVSSEVPVVVTWFERDEDGKPRPHTETVR